MQAISKKTVKVEFALDLLSVADQFLVEKLKMLCENSIQKSIDVDNVAHMLSTVDQRQAHGLRKKCFEYILRHFGKVIGTQAFSEISKPLLQEVLFAASKRGVHLRWRWVGGVRVGWRIVNKIYVKPMWWVPFLLSSVLRVRRATSYCVLFIFQSSYLAPAVVSPIFCWHLLDLFPFPSLIQLFSSCCAIYTYSTATPK